MVGRTQVFEANGRPPLLWPFGISFGIHLVLLVVFIYSPQWRPDQPFIPSVIDVQMVELPDRAAAKAPTGKSDMEKAPVEQASKRVEPKPAATRAQTKEKPEVSVAPRRKKTKTALKYKTFKPEEVKKEALKRLKQKVKTETPRPLEDRIKQLREKVAKEGKPSRAGPTAEEGAKTAKDGVYSRGSGQEIELINLYRLEIAYQVQKNWAFAAQLSGGTGRAMAKIAFKVRPDGEIVDIFFTDRSGNQYLDDSAHKAIVKSSPVKPHPKELSQPYVEMGLRFTPEGVR